MVITEADGLIEYLGEKFCITYAEAQGVSHSHILEADEGWER